MYDFHDKIARLCLDHFKNLPETGKPKENEWTILSCIVQDSPPDNLKVVALGTGTKCIGKNKLSRKGDILNDSHAEVICRRAFVAYLYDEILNSNSSLLEFERNSRKFIIKNGVKFHFFTTHVPCGDAAIFPKQDAEDFGNAIDSTLRQKRTQEEPPKQAVKKIKTDIYRTGAKCLETDPNQDLKIKGTDYHKTGLVRTKPGRGVRTLSVSCSDKLAKWGCLGLQGALLNRLISKPIYLSTFTITSGTPFCENALKRALFERTGGLNLQAPFETTFLKVGQAKCDFDFAKTMKKSPCPDSIIWFPNRLEVAVDGRRQGLTKKALAKGQGQLRICKRELFKQFLEVFNKYDLKISGSMEELSYKRAKNLAVEYQEAWRQLKDDGFKIWTQKNILFDCL